MSFPTPSQSRKLQSCRTLGPPRSPRLVRYVVSCLDWSARFFLYLTSYLPGQLCNSNLFDHISGGFWAAYSTYSKIRTGATRPEAERGLGLPDFPGSPTLVALLTPSKLVGIIEAWGRKGRPALEAYLYPEIFALLAGCFLFMFIMSYLIGISERGNPRLNLLPMSALVTGIVEILLTALLVTSWPAKDIRGVVIPSIIGLHAIKVASLIGTFVVIGYVILAGLPGLLREAGIQGAAPAKPGPAAPTLTNGATGTATDTPAKRRAAKRAN